MEDILEALVLYYKNRPTAYDALNDLQEEFLHNPKKTVETFGNMIRDDCLSHSLCPVCFNELVSKKEIINYGLDFQGASVNESKSIRYCLSCHWKENQ